MGRKHESEESYETPKSLWGSWPSDLWPDPKEPLRFKVPSATPNPSSELPANPELQTAGGFAPVYESYRDKKRRCQHCGATYIFTAAEQKHWYEELKFYTRSKPTGCQECRRKLRRVKQLNGLVQERLATIDHKDWTALRELGQLYEQMGRRTKAVETLRRAKNLCPSQGPREQILREIDQAHACTEILLPNNQFLYLRHISSTTKPENFKWTIARAQPFMSEEGAEILAEVIRRWTVARYGPSSIATTEFGSATTRP